MPKEEGAYLLGQPTFTKLPNGRLRCVETGHELSERDKESYFKGKRCRMDLINYALAKQKPPLNMFTQDPDSRSNLICKLTGDSVSKSEEQIWKHINGRRFLSKLEKQEQEKQIAIELHEDGPARKKLKKKDKKGKRKEIMIDESDSEAVEFSKKKRMSGMDFWSPPKGLRCYFDDGGDRSASASEPGSDFEEGSDNDNWNSEEMPNKKKRKSIETGDDMSASRKKKSNIDEFARGSPMEDDRGKASKSFTHPGIALTDSCEAPHQVPFDSEEPQENHDLPIVADNIPLNSEDAGDMNDETPVPRAPVAAAYGSFTSHGVVRDITHILKENFMGPYEIWAAIPLDIRKLYWKKFQEKYIVEEEKYHEIKKVWEITSKRRYTSMLAEARKDVLRKTGKKSISETKGKGPTWMKPAIWNAIVDKWDTPQWKVKSQMARKNRMTEKDGSITKHRGGSVSFAEHRLRLANELGREPTQAELFQRLHKGKGNSGEFIDNKSKRVMEAYEALLVEKYGAEGASQVIFDEEAWKKVTGGPNKDGKLYGYYKPQDRSSASSPCSSRSAGGPSQSSSEQLQLQDVLKANEALQSKIDEQKLEMVQQKLQMEERMEQQQSQIEMMHSKMVSLMAELDGRRVLRPRSAGKNNTSLE